MPRIPTTTIFLLGLLAIIVSGSSAPTFCKCTCFSNYTIIPLGPQHDIDNPQQPPSDTTPPGTADPPPSDPDTAPPDSSKQTRFPFPFDNDGDANQELSFPAARRSLGRRVTSLEEGEHPSSSSSSPPLLGRMPVEKRASSSSCAQCNRAFCLGYNLPICKEAEEKDVQTMCFQRDSRKDQIIVWGFILGTAGLLGWAGVRRLLEARESRRGMQRRGEEVDRGSYRPVGTDGHA